MKTEEECEKVITKFLEFDCFSDLQFVQYFKGFELLRRWIMEHHGQVADFSNLDFEAIDTKVLANETKEKADKPIAEAIEGDATTVGAIDETHMDEGHIEEVIVAP